MHGYSFSWVIAFKMSTFWNQKYKFFLKYHCKTFCEIIHQLTISCYNINELEKRHYFWKVFIATCTLIFFILWELMDSCHFFLSILTFPESVVVPLTFVIVDYMKWWYIYLLYGWSQTLRSRPFLFYEIRAIFWCTPFFVQLWPMKRSH